EGARAVDPPSRDRTRAAVACGRGRRRRRRSGAGRSHTPAAHRPTTRIGDRAHGLGRDRSRSGSRIAWETRGFGAPRTELGGLRRCQVGTDDALVPRWGSPDVIDRGGGLAVGGEFL